MTQHRISVGPADVARIREALGPTLRVAYEAVHVYPLSAPAFRPAAGAERTRPDAPSLRLYVHVPFCNYGCSFCFYAKKIGASRAQMERYVRALVRELEWITPGAYLTQLYVGGGTPTALPPDLLDEVLAALFARTRREGAEAHTVESSPESVLPQHLDVLRRHGIDRISLGIQSMDPLVLDAIHRRHSREQALDAVDMLVASGLITGADFIYGLPAQTEASFRRDLEDVAARGVDALTLYNLRLNEMTPLAATMGELERLDLERLVRWRAFVHEVTSELGFVQTRWHTFNRETSERARRYDRAPCVDGFGAGHQLGVGVSAVSHLGDTVYRNEETLGAYVERMESGASPVSGVFPLDVEDRKTLFIVRSLGDGRPLDRARYADLFGVAFDDEYGEVLARLRNAGLLDESGDLLALSDLGKLVYDLVTLAFYPRSARAWLLERQSRDRARTVAASA
ncbi:MAG TPA: coproporphyrinogen-III oxidase family protein [Candidatus Binatia bacterium]